MINAKRHKKNFLWPALLIAAVLLFSGCAGQQKEKQGDEFTRKWRETAEKTRGYSPPARKTESAVSEEKKVRDIAESPAKPKPSHRLPTQKTTLEMYDTQVPVLLRAMARAVGQNIMISENVTGKISIDVREAPWDQVFLGVLRTHGLTHGWQGDIIHVGTTEDQDKQFKQIEVEQKIKAKKREIELVEPLLTRIVKVNYGDAKKLKENLDKFLTEKSEGKPLGSVMVDEHTNSLILQAIREDIEKMVPLIESLDRPTPQVLIESQIVEATESTARELGIKWGGVYDGRDLWLGSNASEGVGSGVTPDSQLNPSSGYGVNFPADLVDGTGFTLGLIAQDVGSAILAMELQALEKQGKLNILSSPSITTLDHQEAVIESGKEVPYQTVENDEVQIQYKKVVLSLKVIPHVIDENTLKLEIETNNDELDWVNEVGGNPAVTTKKATTSVFVYDGQTTVIGGLKKEKSDKSKSGVPYLQDVPLLGFLFRGKSDSNELEDLLIFITPHILKERNADMPRPTGRVIEEPIDNPRPAAPARPDSTVQAQEPLPVPTGGPAQ